MHHSDFRIGTEFTTAAGRWRCTDVGTRVVVAIRLDHPEDPSWYNGPAYAVAEVVFDEYDMEECEPAGALTVGASTGAPAGALANAPRRATAEQPPSRPAGAPGRARRHVVLTETLAGVDGCPGGWVAATLRPNEPVDYRVFGAFAEIVAEVEAGRIGRVIIDIPIGLPDRESRRVDVEARRRLGAARGPAVFPAPYRAVLGAASHEEASARRAAVDGKRMSIQAAAILPKIAEVDAAMTPALQAHIREGHPEVTFAALLGKAVPERKRTAGGWSSRVGLLQLFFAEAGLFHLDRPPRLPGTEPDDLVDALAMLASAVRWATGAAEVLPAGAPQVDGHGLRAEMLV